MWVTFGEQRLSWIGDCILPTAGDFVQFKITDAKFHVTIVTCLLKTV